MGKYGRWDHNPMKSNLQSTTNPTPSAAIPDVVEVKEQLERILDSPEFVTSKRLSNFLRFVTERALAGEAESIKQYTIGVEVYGREPSFDPKADPLVRIEAGRLRRTLDKYYKDRGTLDSVLIRIPRGTYKPRFARLEAYSKRAQIKEVSAKTVRMEAIKPPVIAVYPFENLSEERHAYLINGLGEELTAELSRCSGLRVVAFCSMVRLAESQRDIQEVASAVGANFVLTGTLRKSAKRVRINVHLLDVGTGEQLWGQRFDEDFFPNQLFDLEDKIVREVLAQVADTYGVIPRMMSLRAEGRRVSEPSAYEAILRCLHYQLTMTPEAFRESLPALEHASQIEPNSAIVWAMLSQSYFDAEVFGYGPIPGALKDGIRFAGRAVSLDPSCQIAQHAKAYASLIGRDRAAMIAAAEHMVTINPNVAFMVGCAGFWLCLAGEYERGMKLFQTSIELNPLFPAWLHAGPYFYYLDKGNYEQALHHANEFGLPDFFWGPLIRAAVLGLLGRTNDAARTAYVSLLELKPDFAANAADYVRFFLLDDRLAEKMLIGLTKAGLADRTLD